jgi:hypothetical protein
MATLACVFGLSANAGTTIDVAFKDAVSPTGITIDPGDGGGGPGCYFYGYYGATAGTAMGYTSTGRCMEVVLTTTDDLIISSVFVSYDSNNGLNWTYMKEWRGVGVSWNAKDGMLVQNCVLADGIVAGGGLLGTFDCQVNPPNNPPVLPAGTYRLGTIVWDTSSTTSGTELISVVISAVGAIINGNIVNVGPLGINTAVVGSHVLNIIPEPGTASLLGLGLVGLILAGRRSRG